MTTSATFSRAWRMAVAAAILVATPALFVAPPTADRAVTRARAAPPDFSAALQQESFRRFAEQFVAAAARGDRAETARMLSPSAVARAGEAGIDRFLAGEVLPFFAPFKEFARSVSVTRTADAPGFVFYMYMVSRTDEIRPFVIYVIEEGGAHVVANVLVDLFVEGRHCLKIASGWKCPDFG